MSDTAVRGWGRVFLLRLRHKSSGADVHLFAVSILDSSSSTAQLAELQAALTAKGASVSSFEGRAYVAVFVASVLIVTQMLLSYRRPRAPAGLSPRWCALALCLTSISSIMTVVCEAGLWRSTGVPFARASLRLPVCCGRNSFEVVVGSKFLAFSRLIDGGYPDNAALVAVRDVPVACA